MSSGKCYYSRTSAFSIYNGARGIWCHVNYFIDILFIFLYYIFLIGKKVFYQS